MRKVFWVLLVAVAILGLMLSGVQASSLIVTTGTPAGPNFVIGSDIEVGGQFTLGQAYKISDIQFYISGYGHSTPLPTTVCYDTTNTSGDHVPGNPILGFFISGPDDSIGWKGANFDMGLHLDAGSYWVVIQPMLQGLLPFNAPWSIGWVGYKPGADEWVTTYPGEQIGYQVFGEVPVPPGVWLLGSGLLGLVGWRRLRKI